MNQLEIEKAWDESISIFLKALNEGKPMDELLRIWRRITILSDIIDRVKISPN